MRWILCSIIVAVAWGVSLTAQQRQNAPAQPTFRAVTQLIVQSVTVTDRDGAPVEGLTADDFIVTENGESQEVAFVEFHRLTSPGPATSAAPSDSGATIPGAPEAAPPPPDRTGALARLDVRYRNRRLIVLYFDLSAMSEGDALRAFQGAVQFVNDHLRPPDLVAVMTYQRGVVRLQQEFTDDRPRLRDVLQALMYDDGLHGDGLAQFGQNDAEFNLFNTNRQLSALQTAVTMFRPHAERTSLIYFASQLRLNGTDNQAQYRATVNAAIVANVSINPIDARGLVAFPPLGDATTPSTGGIALFSGARAQARVSRFERSQDTLHALAGDTGGVATFDYNDLAPGIVRATQDVSSYYTVGYYSTHIEADGRFRRVEITLPGRRAADVSYRRGYFGEKLFAEFSDADKERQLEEALMLGSPITDLTIALEVNYFQLNRAEYFVPVSIKIPGSELVLARRRDGHRLVVDFIGEVRTAYGLTIQNLRDKLDITLDDQTASQFASRPIQYETGFTLLPDDYVLRFLARDAESGKIGTYEAAFTVPNLNRELEQIPTSSVVLSSQWLPSGEELYSIGQDIDADAINPLVHDGRKVVPSVTRVFTQDRILHVLLEAYRREDEPFAAYLALYREGGKVIETPPVVAATGRPDRARAVPLRFALPLQEIMVGRYDVQVSVLDPTGARVAFWRAPLLVVP